MRPLVVPHHATLERLGADLLSGFIRERPAGLVVPALGRSALGIYAELGRRVAAGRLDTSRIVLAQLDEYVGIGVDDPRSLYAWLLRDVAAPLRIPPERVLRLVGEAPDPGFAAEAHRAAIAERGEIDVAILGLGLNGHIGFNEPPSDMDAPTRIVTLTPDSLTSSAAYWASSNGLRPLAVPEQALTIGMRELLAARQTLLVVTGEQKRGVLRRLLLDPPSPDLPGGFLRDRESVVLLADEAAWPAEVPWPPEAAA